MFISKKRFNEEINKALRQEEEKRYIHQRIDETGRYAHERIDRLERMVYELESIVKAPLVTEGVALQEVEAKTTL